MGSTERPLTAGVRPGGEPVDIAAYESAGGYAALRHAVLHLSSVEVQQLVTDAKLRGRGGAGFATGQKWSFVPMGPEARRPKYLVANADEMEPGTFKDRYLMEGNPHQLIEGMIVSAYAIEADIAFIFLRWAYKLAERRLSEAIRDAYSAGYLGQHILGSTYSLDLYLHTGAGRYICGEETALLNSMEGDRARPRSKPPFPQVTGLWGKPTIVNNVETLSNVPHIVRNGAEWYRGLSLGEDSGTKLYGASGKVRRPGVWELPMGTTIREIFEENAGGMVDGVQLRAVMPGGASTEFLLPEHLDVKMDYDSVQRAGSRFGTGALIVLDSATCPVGMVANLAHFFAQESCGWCTPCREGLPRVARLAREIEDGRGEPEDLGELERLCQLIGPLGRTFCALAPGAIEPIQSALRCFPEDFRRHIAEHRCPWR